MAHMAHMTPVPASPAGPRDILRALLSGMPGGASALYVTMVALVGAELAVLWIVESVLVGGEIRPQHLVAFVGGGLLASLDLEQAQHRSEF